MENKHFYKNHQEVLSILTEQYGFTYEGIGDNAEECFRTDSDKPETIFIHPMSCSYYMASPRGTFGPRLHTFKIESDHKSEKSQLIAFRKLLIHLDEVAIKEATSPVPTRQKLPNLKKRVSKHTLVVEPKRLTLWQRLCPW